MADLVWPLTLPQEVLRDSFTDTKAPNVISTDFEIGPAQQRPRSTFQNSTYECTIRLTMSQKIVFDNFYQNTTLFGTQAFDFPDFYVDGATIEVKFSPSVDNTTTSIGGDYVDISFGLDLQS